MTISTVKMGLVSTGVYLPKDRHTAAYISEQTGIPEDILKMKLISKEIYQLSFIGDIIMILVILILQGGWVTDI